MNLKVTKSAMVVIAIPHLEAKLYNKQLYNPLRALSLDFTLSSSPFRLRSVSRCILKYRIGCCCDAIGMLSSRSGVYGSTLTMHQVTSVHKIMHSSTSTRPLPRRNFLSHQDGLVAFRFVYQRDSCEPFRKDRVE
jgi:hypothetical protein